MDESNINMSDDTNMDKARLEVDGHTSLDKTGKDQLQVNSFSIFQ